MNLEARFKLCLREHSTPPTSGQLFSRLDWLSFVVIVWRLLLTSWSEHWGNDASDDCSSSKNGRGSTSSSPGSIMVDEAGVQSFCVCINSTNGLLDDPVNLVILFDLEVLRDICLFLSEEVPCFEVSSGCGSVFGIGVMAPRHINTITSCCSVPFCDVTCVLCWTQRKDFCLTISLSSRVSCNRNTRLYWGAPRLNASRECSRCFGGGVTIFRHGVPKTDCTKHSRCCGSIVKPD